MRILLVEDDLSIALPIMRALRKEFAADHAHNCRQAELLLDLHSYHLLIIDLGLPDGCGTRICEQQGKDCDIIILSGDISEKTRVFHLQNYATDYVCKPFSLSELLARVHNVQKTALRKPPSIQKNGLYVDSIHKQAVIDGAPLPLRRKEFEILSVLEKHMGQPVVKSLLLEEVWDEENEPFSNTIDAHVCSLRKALKQSDCRYVIQTIRGIGYVLTEPPATAPRAFE